MRINIEKLPVNVCLGFYPEERRHKQTAFVSIAIHIDDHTGAGASDQLAQTVDYAQVIQAVDRTLEGREFKLVEAVVERIGVTVMEEQPLVDQLDVKVVKTVLPRNCARGAEVSVSKSFKRRR
jgi:FolB domain-containing protein